MKTSTHHEDGDFLPVRDDSMCPICMGLPRDPKTRKAVNGHWCMPCQDEYDSIDWEEYYERRMEGL